MEFVLDDYHHNTPDEELIADLKDVAKLINKNTVTMEEYDNYGNYHPTT